MRAKWTDLAVEACGSASKSDTERLACGMERLTVRIDSERDAQAMGRPCGVYVTLTCPQTMSIALKTRQALAHELAMTLRSMLPKARKSILVVGLGNRNVTPDSLGPRTAERILVTRHMAECLPEDIAQSMASVSAAAPGFLGVTGHGNGGDSERHGLRMFNRTPSLPSTRLRREAHRASPRPYRLPIQASRPVQA